MRGLSAWRHVAGLAFGATLVLAPPAMAQDMSAGGASMASPPLDPQRLALAEQLFRAMHLDTSLRGTMTNVFKAVPGLADSGDTNPKAQLLMSSLSVGFDAAFPDMIQAMAEVYARELTVRELEDSLTFYASPSGQAIITKMPAMMREAAPLSIKMLPKMAAVAEQDYCSHVACERICEAQAE